MFFYRTSCTRNGNELFQVSFRRMSKDAFGTPSFRRYIVAGCGNGMARVSGTVTLDGQIVSGPDKFGTVTFYRESGGGAPAVGVLDQSGRYSLKTGSSDGVEPGLYRSGLGKESHSTGVKTTPYPSPR